MSLQLQVSVGQMRLERTLYTESDYLRTLEHVLKVPGTTCQYDPALVPQLISGLQQNYKPYESHNLTFGSASHLVPVKLHLMPMDQVLSKTRYAHLYNHQCNMCGWVEATSLALLDYLASVEPQFVARPGKNSA